MADGQGDAPVPVLQRLLDRLAPGVPALTVLTGAGVSTESGVPDFRSPDSPWRVHTPISFPDFLRDPAMRAEALRRKFAMDDLYRDARPGRSHRALVRLAELGLVRAMVTQNIDGLHQAAGLDPALLVELHGNGTYAHCLDCGGRFDLVEIRRHLEATGEAPVCACGGFIKSATIAFGQPLRPGVMAAAVEASQDCAVFLAVGSSLVVRPAARLPALAKEAGAFVAIVNREPTPLDGLADVVIRGEAGDVLDALATRAEEQHIPAFRRRPPAEGHY